MNDKQLPEDNKKPKKKKKIREVREVVDICGCGAKYYDLLGIGKCWNCFKKYQTPNT